MGYKYPNTVKQDLQEFCNLSMEKMARLGLQYYKKAYDGLVAAGAGTIGAECALEVFSGYIATRSGPISTSEATFYAGCCGNKMNEHEARNVLERGRYKGDSLQDSFHWKGLDTGSLLRYIPGHFL